MRERNQRKQIQRALADYSPSIYSKALSKYLKTTAKILDPLFRTISYHSPLCTLFPLYQLIRATAKLFLLSQMEFLLVAYQLNQLKWNLEDQVTLEASKQMGQLICFAQDGGQCRKLALSLMLISYWAKCALNNDCDWLLEEASKICINFKQIFEEWSGQNNLSQPISLKELNVFSSFMRTSLYSSSCHYNYIVDQIVQLSHPYNPQKQSLSNAIKLSHHEQFLEENSLKTPRKMIKLDVEATFLPPILPQIEPSEGDCKIESINLFGQNHNGDSQKFSRFFDSYSLNMPLPSLRFQQSMKQDGVDCDYIEVGLCEGESAQLFVMEEKFTSSILTSRILFDKDR